MSENKLRTDQLQFLRFLAFLLVFFQHGTEYQFDWMPQGGGSCIAVSFFFILSGAVSGMAAYQKDVVCNPKAIGKYVWGKAKRFYPLYFFTTIYMVMFTDFPRIMENSLWELLGRHIERLIVNLLMLQSLVPHGYYYLNGFSWFMSAIMVCFVVALPLRALYSWVSKKKNALLYFVLMFALGYVALLVYCYQVGPYGVKPLPENVGLEYFGYVFPGARVLEYFCGMALGCIVSVTAVGEAPGKGRKVVFSVLEVLAIAFCCYAMYTTKVENWDYFIFRYLLPNSLLILVFAYGHGVLSQLFRLERLKKLGDLTFDFYIVHGPIIMTYREVSGLGAASVLGKVFSMLFCLLLTCLVVGYLERLKAKHA